MSIPSIFCPACRVKGEPGAGFIEGPKGPTEQIAFWCLSCGQQIPVSVEWQDPSFRSAVLAEINPFEHPFPQLRVRIGGASKPQSVVPGDLATARDWLHNKLDDGAQCPCCDQHAQRYYRTLNSGIGRWLLALVAMRPEGATNWVSTKDVIQHAAARRGFGSSLGSGEAPSLLPFWGLIETRPSDDPDKKHSGVWRPTKDGYDFAHDRKRVPRRAVVYNNVLDRLEGDLIGIRECLGKKFSYDELMGAGRMVSAEKSGT
jgi:hypothetical protein